MPQSNPNKLIVLDRDGVINQDSPDYVKTPAEWHALPGSLEAIARLHHAGWRVVVATNQAGIGRGLFDFDALFAINDKMQRQVAELGGRIDGIFFCPHPPEAQCDCRKPAPGLLLDIERRLQVSLNNVPFVGDSLRDLQAAAAAGARPVLVRTGNGAQSEDQARQQFPDLAVYDDLSATAAALLNNKAG
ncbi:MAG: D-glycero-beta-D-manno-heptose 1,7-bisphosphate 7-phosphatase [Nevskiales bacterium]